MVDSSTSRVASSQIIKRPSPSVLRVGIFLGPFLRCLDSSLFVFLPALCNVGSERVIGVRGSKKGLD